MMDMNDVFVLTVTKGMGSVNDEISIYGMKPDLYELMEVIADSEPHMTFNDVKSLALEISEEGYVREGIIEYTLTIKHVQYG